MLQVPSLSGIGALRIGNEDFSAPFSGRNKGGGAGSETNLNLAVAGRNAQANVSKRSEASGKAKLLLKEVEDLYQGFQQRGEKGERGERGESNRKGQSEDINMRGGRGDDLKGKVNFPDPYVDDEFGDESVDTIMSDTSDHSELTPRGDRPHIRRQNGPRGYGQGKVGIKQSSQPNNAAKPTKFKLQGGQRPLKISVKERQAQSELNRNPSETIATLGVVAQSYQTSIDREREREGGNNGPVLLQVDKGRNRSLPTLQHKQYGH